MLYCRMDVGLFQAYPKTFILTPPCKTRRPKKGAAFFLVVPLALEGCQENSTIGIKKSPLTIAALLG